MATLLELSRYAKLRELASLGCTMSESARLLGLDVAQVFRIKKKYGLEMVRGRDGFKPWLPELIIRDYGKDGVTARVMAERYGSTSSSVKTTVCRLKQAGLIPAIPKPLPSMAKG